MDRFLCLTPFFACAAYVGIAQGASFVFTPVSDRDAGPDNVLRPDINDTLKVSADGWRFALEFELPAFEPSLVVSATLTMHPRIVEAPGAKEYLIHGYEADGVVTLSDLNVVNPIVPPLSSNTIGSPIDVTDFLRLLPVTTTHVGFRFQSTGADFVITSSESGLPPLLNISKVPEPTSASLVYMMVGAVFSFGPLALQPSRSRNRSRDEHR